jgi:hypothetical protein
MPKRTNPRQQVIELLEGMRAGPTCTVTPSKFLRDVLTGENVEVDVVVEYPIDGGTFTRSFEVVAKTRRADFVWVNSMIRKHQTLPTNQLYLVSWSGFTKGAQKQAATEARITLCTPTMVAGPDGPRLKTIDVGHVRMIPRRVQLVFRRPDGSEGWFNAEPDMALLSPTREVLGSVLEFTEWLLQDQTITRRMHELAYRHPERDDLKSFVVGGEIGDLNAHLHEQDADQLHHVERFEVSGDFVVEVQPLNLEVRELRDETFAHGTADVAGRHATFVTRLNESLDISNAIAHFDPPKPKGEE